MDINGVMGPYTSNWFLGSHLAEFFSSVETDVMTSLFGNQVMKVHFGPNSKPLKTGGWKTIHSYWEGQFSGETCC